MKESRQRLLQTIKYQLQRKNSALSLCGCYSQVVTDVISKAKPISILARHLTTAGYDVRAMSQNYVGMVVTWPCAKHIPSARLAKLPHSRLGPDRQP